MKRPVIVSSSCITPLGKGISKNWKALSAGDSAIQSIRRFDPVNCDFPFAGTIIEDYSEGLPNSGRSMITKQNGYLLWSILDAWNCSPLTRFDDSQKDAISIYLGTGYLAAEEKLYKAFVDLTKAQSEEPNIDGLCNNYERIPPLDVIKTMATSANNFVAKQFSLHGAGNPIFNGDTSGLSALNQAARDIQCGYVDCAIVAASEYYISPHIYYFLESSMRNLQPSKDCEPETASRPFDRSASGLVFSEGAACIILMSESFALEVGAEPEVFVKPGADNLFSENDYFADFSESYFKNNIEQTLYDSKTDASCIDLVIPFSPSHPKWDLEELNAISKTLTHASFDIVSIKGNLGFMSAVTGLLDCVFAQSMLVKEELLPVKNFKQLSDGVTSGIESHIVTKNKKRRVNNCLVNNAGFGGYYSSVILEKRKKNNV